MASSPVKLAGKLLTVIFLIAFCNCDTSKSLKLKQVLILGRHNIRAPLASNLEKLSPKPWPKWKEDVGYLTEKGSLLENFMGDYFSKWLHREKLFKGCPEKKSVFIYANVLPRTRDSARAFAKTAFKNCNVSVYIKPSVLSDPTFHPVILNTTESFKNIVTSEMRKKLNNTHLSDAYTVLNEILDFRNSKLCNDTGFCDLVTTRNKILFQIGQEPVIEGPLRIGNSAVDAFLMSYYNGAPLEDIGWGQIRPDSWILLTRITKENQNVRFNSTTLARDVAKPLLRLFYQILSKDDLKFTALVGHDSNINAIIASLRFKPYVLKDNYEWTPVGGKIVFQRWHDEDLNKYYLRINYVYQTTEQLRQGSRLTLANPPKSVLLELLDCKMDKNGYCPWNDFINVLEAVQ